MQARTLRPLGEQSMRRAWFALVGCCALSAVGRAAPSDELVPGPLVEPGAPPVTALAAEIPGELLTDPGRVSALRLEFFEPDLLRVAPIAGPGAAGSLCGPIFGIGPWSPCASAPGVPVGTIEVAPAEIRFVLGDRASTLLSGSILPGLTWDLGLASRSAAALDLGAEHPSVERQSDLGPRLTWGGLSLRSTLLHSEWSLEDLAFCVPDDSIEVGYAGSTRLPALNADARAAWALRGLGSGQPDWNAELGLDAVSEVGACLVRPQVALSWHGQDREVQDTLRAAVEVEGELRAGRAFDLVLEYFSQEVVSGLLQPGDAPEQRVLLRLVF